MQGGTFTVTHLGGLGATSLTPIVYPPQSAILGVSRTICQPVYREWTEYFRPRRMLPLSLSDEQGRLKAAPWSSPPGPRGRSAAHG